MAKTEPPNRCLGYARVSTYGQTLDAQLEQLRGAGCTKIYREKVTGAHNDRRELLKMLKAVARGDVVTVTRIDRLARRRPQPGAEARPAYGPSPEIDGRAAGRGPPTPGRGCHPRRARPQLPRGEKHDFTAQMKSKEGFRQKFSVLG